MQYNMSNDVMPWPMQRRVGGPQDAGGDYGPDSGYIGQNINPLQQLLTRAGGTNNMFGGGAGGGGLQALIQRLLASQGMQQQAPPDLVERFAGLNRPPADLVERFAQQHPQGQGIDPGFYKTAGSQARPAAIMGSHMLASQLADFIQRSRTPALRASASSWMRSRR